MKQIKIPIPEFTPVTKFHLTKKCRSCAYHTHSTTDEDDMTRDYWHEHPVPHQCHERQKGYACVGAAESFKRLGLPIQPPPERDAE